MPGRFLTFEGLDGSGKSTHLARARSWMESRGLPCLCTQEPGGTDVGERIRSIFLDHGLRPMPIAEALLVFASRHQHLGEVIEPALARGEHVLCDRFTDSTLAYQGSGRGLEIDWILRLDRLATGSRAPDRTLLFDVDPEVARGRRHREGDRLDAEELAFYHRVAEGFRDLAARWPERVAVIDARGSKDRTWTQVEKVLEEVVGS